MGLSPSGGGASRTPVSQNLNHLRMQERAPHIAAPQRSAEAASQTGREVAQQLRVEVRAWLNICA